MKPVIIAYAAFLLLLLRLDVAEPTCAELPDCLRSAEELIQAYGFIPEAHTCRTPDGFYLTIHRITKAEHHNGREGSLGFVLADAGYDVWLGNSRGNVYSLAHESMLPTEERFWAWTWDEMAMYDLPTMVSYIKSLSGSQTVSLVAHSQGTLQVFAALSLPGPVADKLAQDLGVFVALAPVAYIAHLGSPLLRAFSDLPQAEVDLFFGSKGFLPSSERLRTLLPQICTESPYACESVACMISGCNPHANKHFNLTRWPVYAAHYPSGTSVRNMIHFRQMVRGSSLQMFDYGSAKANQQAYGQAEPPLYALANVRPVHIALMCGTDDVLADTLDITRLVEELPASVIMAHEVFKGYDHMAFVWGQDASTILFPKILSALSSEQGLVV